MRKFRGEAAEKARLGSALPQKAKASAAKKDAPPLLLAQTWDNDRNLNSWWLSEKLDGVRANWDGKRFLSRLGNVYHAPDWFIESLSKDPLDGELWIDRKCFQKTVSIVRRQDKSEHWKEIQFVVFDAPSHQGPFEKRQAHLRMLMGKVNQSHLVALEQVLCKGTPLLQKELARVEKLGGEGLMLREPDSLYEVGASHRIQDDLDGLRMTYYSW